MAYPEYNLALTRKGDCRSSRRATNDFSARQRCFPSPPRCPHSDRRPISHLPFSQLRIRSLIAKEIQSIWSVTHQHKVVSTGQTCRLSFANEMTIECTTGGEIPVSTVSSFVEGPTSRAVVNFPIAGRFDF